MTSGFHHWSRLTPALRLTRDNVRGFRSSGPAALKEHRDARVVFPGPQHRHQCSSHCGTVPWLLVHAGRRFHSAAPADARAPPHFTEAAVLWAEAPSAEASSLGDSGRHEQLWLPLQASHGCALPISHMCRLHTPGTWTQWGQSHPPPLKPSPCCSLTVVCYVAGALWALVVVSEVGEDWALRTGGQEAFCQVLSRSRPQAVVNR